MGKNIIICCDGTSNEFGAGANTVRPIQGRTICGIYRRKKCEITMKAFSACLCLGYLTLGSLYSSPLFTVDRYEFCTNVIAREPENKLLTITTLEKTKPRLYLWMEIRGGEQALRMLRAWGKMPIYHSWICGGLVIDKINIGLDNDDWRKWKLSLENQFKEQGYFTYRTQSYKEDQYPSDWKVTILDANNNLVSSVQSQPLAIKPSINIKP